MRVKLLALIPAQYGHETPFASNAFIKEDLIRNKRTSGRTMDLADAEKLEKKREN